MKQFKIFSLVLLGLCAISVLPSSAQEATKVDVKVKKMAAPKPATVLLEAAYKKAKKEKKTVLAMFHATWCGWCHKLEAVMAKPDFKKQFEKNYVIVNVDVLENGDKIAQFENPGGRDRMAELGGEKSGLPFYAFLNDKGEKLADSNVMPNAKTPEVKDQNIGYPGAPEEIEAFMALIKRTAPKWAEADQDKLHAYLKENAPKSGR